jgi:hypothetical protein
MQNTTISPQKNHVVTPTFLKYPGKNPTHPSRTTPKKITHNMKIETQNKQKRASPTQPYNPHKEGNTADPKAVCSHGHDE